MSTNYSYQLFELDEAITPYGTIVTKSPEKSTVTISNFTDGTHYRTGPDADGALQLELDARLLTVIIDESGSMTWNDTDGHRYEFCKRLLRKLDNTYPGTISANLIGFGGTPAKTTIFLAQSGEDFLTNTGQDFDQFLQEIFQDSVFDFSGVRVVRRTDRFPGHPADGLIVTEGIFEAAKDQNLVTGQTYYYGIWTFNKNSHFSVGKFIKIAPRDRILPRGINLATATPRILPGVLRDDYSQLIYNFVEEDGFLVFDSSGNGFHGSVGSEVIEDNFWSGDAPSGSYASNNLKKPQGVRFDGEFDIVETDISNPDQLVLTSSQSLTVNLWLFRYPNDQNQWLIGTIDESTNLSGWTIGLTSLGTIGVCLGDLSAGLTSIGPVIPSKTWTMITVILSNTGVSTWSATLFVNGVEQSSTTIVASPSTTIDKLFIGAKPSSTGDAWSGTDYFGSLGQISVHNKSRTNLEIEALYTQEQTIFSQNLQSSVQQSPDNNQREVLLTWEIADDFNYENGTVTVVRKYNSVPSHVDDGTIVTQVSAEPGQFFYIDAYDFIAGGNYYYRIFTRNALGNVCDRLEARILSVRIQSYRDQSTPDTELSPISDFTITPGNRKLLLQWQNPNDDRVVGTKVFFSCSAFPVVDYNVSGTLTVSSGYQILDTTEEFFAHRVSAISNAGSTIPLSNGVTHYYTIVTYDRLGRISSPVYSTGIPSSQLSTIFEPDDVRDLHVDVLNPNTVSLQWKNPTVKSEQIDLYFGEAALIFVSVRDLFGGELDDITNLRLQFCTTFVARPLKTSERPLAGGQNNVSPEITGECGSLSGNNGPIGGTGYSGDGGFGGSFDENCNTIEQEQETVLTYAAVESGLVKGIITHTNDRQILSRRSRYVMDVRAQYHVNDPDDPGANLFEFNTDVVRVNFQHPIIMSLINRDNKRISVKNSHDGGYRGDDSPCECPQENDNNNNESKQFNGGYARANSPYVCRVEIQYKGENLPEGTPINAELFKHTDNNTFAEKSNRTFIREGRYLTTTIIDDETDATGTSTGRTVSKSIVDIEIPHPDLNDFIDLRVTLDYLGLFVEAVHEIRFIESLILVADINWPDADGIDVAEQFANAYIVNPDEPDNPDSWLPVPDGTIVKWELEKLAYGKERPFYSTERIGQIISGVYSSTRGGVSRNVFFGPVGNIENHESSKTCEDDTPQPCCVGEQYAIRATVILDSETATDAVKFFYPCKETLQFTNKRFLMNADPTQPLSGGFQSNPHWITWADGEHMLKFQIAKNPAISTILGADCFRRCVENRVGGQLIPFSDGQIVQVSADAEILWDVVFETDPYTDVQTPVTYQSISPQIAENLGVPLIANIPIRGETTEFYIRYNKFVGDEGNPKPEECETGQGGAGLGSNGDDTLPCQWRNICEESGSCNPTTGQKWVNVSTVTGFSTLISGNKEITLLGGGTYEDGIPPIYIGFREPLDVRIIDARINGQRVDELVVDGLSQHTFTVEAKFAGEPVPDGTPIELKVTGEGQSVVIISNCRNAPVGCAPGSGGTIYTRLVNDPIINPEVAGETVPVRSLAYFTIDPLPDIAFNAKIHVTCRYDKQGTITREITRCIELNNAVNVELPSETPTPDGGGIATTESATSNEIIVYDTINDRYSQSVPSKVRRIGSFAAGVVVDTGDYLYLFGGITGQGDSSTSNLTPRSEIFNITQQTWEFISDMPTPRAFGMTTTIGDSIYCIGGVELDALLNQYVVSRKIEKYDARRGVWDSSLRAMPSDYGVAYGDAQVSPDNRYIYVCCGITTLVNNSQPGVLNDKILRYDIETDTWDTISPSDELLYQRIAPFGFIRTKNDNKQFFIYGGSIPKNPAEVEAERQSKINKLLDDLRAFILGSTYFQNLPLADQEFFVKEREKSIRDEVIVTAFVYPPTGFKFETGSEVEINGEFTIDISDTIDDEWKVLPKSRDHGASVYIPHQDIVYFIGGSNQNRSTTLNRVESIDFSISNTYNKLTSLGRGRSMFSAAPIGDDIYIAGGLTSGHKEGYVQIEVEPTLQYTEARGVQSSGMLISIKNDSGEIINDDIRIDIRGKIRIAGVEEIIADFLAERAADRALGGTGEGDSPDDASFLDAQNKIIDPNSDQFQFNAARKLSEEVSLFPVLYSSQQIVLRGGVGSVTILPRSEDPLTEFEKLSQFIEQRLANTPDDPDERFTGDLTRDELRALGDALATVKLPPTIINSGQIRELYSIETQVTVLDPILFGQTVSEFDLNLQELIDKKIDEKLNPPPSENNPCEGIECSLGFYCQNGKCIPRSGSLLTKSECFLLQHSSSPDIDFSSTPPTSDSARNPRGTGGFAQSGQCLFCQTVLPTNVNVKTQLPTIETVYFNTIEWLPQIKRRLVDSNHSLSSVIEAIEIIDKEVPFGASQLYDALSEAARINSSDELDELAKVVYVVSDNAPNLSLATRDEAIEEINSIDGNKKVPVVYCLFSTSDPPTLSSQLQHSQVGDVEKITEGTGGQAVTLFSEDFLDDILNLALGSATGGLGYGIYNRRITFDELSAITGMTVNFLLPANTQGYLRLRFSSDGFNFSDFTERYVGSSTTDLVDFYAKIIEFEVILTTGFTTDITEEYDNSPTGVPKLLSVVFDTSGEREDFIWVNPETVVTNAQQVAVAVEGDVPTNAIIEIGVATSDSSDWRDYQSDSRPAIREFGKMFILDRTDNPNSIVPLEPLTTIDGRLYKSPYGPWDSTSSATLYQIVSESDGSTSQVPVLTGFRLYARNGEIYFDTRQNEDKIFKLEIVNSDTMKIGLRLRNRNHAEEIVLRGTGFIYSTNDVKPIEFSQVAPRAINLRVSPQAPTAGDTIFALYDYVDLNNDVESGTIISWYKNGLQLLEIQNQISWSNDNLLPQNRLTPNDKISFSIIPSDGQDFGSLVLSPTVTVSPRAPGATSVKIVPFRNGLINNRFDTSSAFVVEYTFDTDDEGFAGLENGTLIQWFINGTLFKTGTFSEVESDPYFDPKSITPGELIGGVSAHVIGNQIVCEVTPKTALVTGELTRSQTITVENSLMLVNSVKVEPLQPTTQSTLRVTYSVDDLDISDFRTQRDQSEIKWFNSPNGRDFAEVRDLRNEDTVTPFYLRSGEHWYCEVTPYDGLEVGPKVQSNTVVIKP